MGTDLNSHADALENLASTFEEESRRIITVDLISAPSIKTNQQTILSNIELRSSWMDPITVFLCHDKLPKEKIKVHKL